MKKVRVFGHTEVTVSVVISVADDATELDIYEAAKKQFTGVHSFSGCGGTDKLIGVHGQNESIAADEAVVFDDCAEEP